MFQPGAGHLPRKFYVEFDKKYALPFGVDSFQVVQKVRLSSDDFPDI
ncbi:MAG: hypothetical protein IPK21_20185 [Haliscomenobacter sp.]|nr:hypothetical protein [Haliscomenobacter sp.]